MSKGLVIRWAVLGVVLLAGVGSPQARNIVAQPRTGLTDAQRAATFTFAPDVVEANKQAFLGAIASASPDAQKLIAEVDGAIQVEVGATPAGSLGFAQGMGNHYLVRVNLAPVFHQHGQRGVNRVVLHELGHVVDALLVADDVKQELDHAIPPGYPCPEGTHQGSCAPREERFAESFAKWAMQDIGVDLYIGYAVPPPHDVAAWGAPLTDLL